jgi:hypothetical protein
MIGIKHFSWFWCEAANIVRVVPAVFRDVVSFVYSSACGYFCKYQNDILVCTAAARTAVSVSCKKAVIEMDGGNCLLAEGGKGQSPLRQAAASNVHMIYRR